MIYYSDLKPGDIFQPPGFPNYRCMKLDDNQFLSLIDYKLQCDVDMDYFINCGDVIVDGGRDMVVELIYERDKWKIVSIEENSFIYESEDEFDDY